MGSRQSGIVALFFLLLVLATDLSQASQPNGFDSTLASSSGPSEPRTAGVQLSDNEAGPTRRSALEVRKAYAKRQYHQRDEAEAKLLPRDSSSLWSPNVGPLFNTTYNADFSPAVINHLNHIWIVWSSGNNGILSSYMQDDGSWVDPVPLSGNLNNTFKTPCAVTLTELNEELHAFWVDPNSKLVHFRYNDTSEAWTRLTDPAFNTVIPPSATVFNESIYLAYLRPPAKDESVMWAVWQNETWSTPLQTGESSWGAPAIVNLNESLHILFATHDDRQIIDIVFNPSNSTWKRAAMLQEWSAGGVSATSWLSGGALTFPANWNTNYNTPPVVCIYRNGGWNTAETWGPKTRDIPAAVALNNVLYDFWLGTNHMIYYNTRSLDQRFLVSTWMGDVPDITPLESMVIPGTHDSATAGGPTIVGVPTQTMSIWEQLQAGIRFFDLRVGETYGSNTIVMMHGPYIIDWTTLGYPLSDVLDDFYTFLQNAPSETILITIKNDGPGSDLDSLADNLFDMFADDYQYWHGYKTSTRLPGSLDNARGQIVLFSRTPELYPNWGLNVSSGWVTNGQNFSIGDINIQDFYDPPGANDITASLNNKWQAISQSLARAQSGDGDTLYFCYSSATQFPNPFGYSAKQFAMGSGQYTIVEGMNERLRQYFDSPSLPTTQAGIFPMDFPEYPEGDLITSLIEANFPRT